MPRKSFLLRIDEKVHRELRRWADDELRSVNAQIEFLLRKAVVDQRGRDRLAEPDPPPSTSDPSSGE
ncbi:MAG: hypothetical protein VX404_03330 [Planctomycetota bacterium]|nr:hypothetical protein [Planctomycetota bacterium]